jgi:hypothetical protein
VVEDAVSEADEVTVKLPAERELTYQRPAGADVFMMRIIEFEYTYGSETTSVLPVVSHCCVFTVLYWNGGNDAAGL